MPSDRFDLILVKGYPTNTRIYTIPAARGTIAIMYISIIKIDNFSEGIFDEMDLKGLLM
jgi:hypothetical protein